MSKARVLLFGVCVALFAAVGLAEQQFPIHIRRIDGPSSPLFSRFLENQRKGFPFPGGKECEEDAHKLCPGILKRCTGDFGCTTQCLADHAPHLSDKCRKNHPCYPDMDKYCADVPPGQNEMMKCLKQHIHDLTPACVKHHPCLDKKQDVPCPVLDYSGKAPPFIRNIAKFLQNMRSGSLFSPLQSIFHMPHPHDQHNYIHQKKRHHEEAMAVEGARQMEKNIEMQRKLIEDEHRLLEEERRDLRHERRELAAERHEVMKQQFETQKDQVRFREKSTKTVDINSPAHVARPDFAIGLIVSVLCLSTVWLFN